MATYYANITDNTVSGVGTIAEPFNYNQLVNYLDPEYMINNPADPESVYPALVSAADGDVVKVRGYSVSRMDIVVRRTPSSINSKACLSFNNSLSGDITLEAWDLETYGPPLFNLPFYYSVHMLNLGTSGGVGEGTIELNITFKDFVIRMGTNDADLLYFANYYYETEKQFNFDFKNCFISSPLIEQFLGPLIVGGAELPNSAAPNINFYGCTIETFSMKMLAPINTITFYDCVLPRINQTPGYNISATTVSADGNVSKYTTFDWQDADVTNWNAPIYAASIIEMSEAVSATEDEHAFFSDENSMLYSNFNIPIGGMSKSFRVTYGYDYGISNNQRMTFGFYAFPPPQGYYTDISNGVAAGNGTQGSPFNYKQMVNFYNPDKVIDGVLAEISATTSVVMYVKGAKNDGFLDDIEQSLDGEHYATFISLHESLSGDIELQGWDIATNGPPVAYHRGSHNVSVIDTGELSAHPYNQDLTVKIKDFIFDKFHDQTDVANTGFACINKYSVHPRRKVTMEFRNVGFKVTEMRHSHFDTSADGFYPVANTSAYGDVAFYGCTIDTAAYIRYFETCKTFEAYDTVFLAPYAFADKYGIRLYLESYNIVKMNNNITTFPNESINFTTQLGAPGDVSEYVQPVTNGSLLNYTNFDDKPSLQIAYYQNKTYMEYKNFNIPDGGATSTFRTTNDYNNGLANDTRLAYGAYVFSFTQEEFSKGHIGAFYFGGEFENVELTVDPPIIYLNPVTSGGTETSAVGPGIINLVVPDIEAIGFNSFPFDFSGTPVSGASPLLVRYHVYNYEPRGQFAGLWEAYEFRWWFDYETSGGDSDYVSCATDRAEWLYCGFYGQTYDVRCCVMYRPIE